MNNPNAAIRTDLFIKDIQKAEKAFRDDDFQTVVKINKSLRRFGIQLIFQNEDDSSMIVPLNDHWRNVLKIEDEA